MGVRHDTSWGSDDGRSHHADPDCPEPTELVIVTLAPVRDMPGWRNTLLDIRALTEAAR